MQELITECLKLVNFPYTLMFGLAMLYWILYVVGAVGSDLFDFDMDMDTDVDAHVHGGIDADGHVHHGDMDGDVHHGGGLLTTVMKFLHVGDVPVTVVATMMSMGMWIASVLSNYYMNNSSLGIALGLFIPIVVVGIIFTRIGLHPFLPFLKNAFDESGDVVEIIGQLGTVASLEANSKYGQLEIAMKGSPITLNVKTRDGEVLKKGDEAVVFDRDEDGETYLIMKFNMKSQEKSRSTEDAAEPQPNKSERSSVKNSNKELER
jgi:hypothetical protein